MTFQMTPQHRKETAGKDSEGKGVNMPSRHWARDPLALNEGRPVGRAGICFSVPWESRAEPQGDTVKRLLASVNTLR